VSGTSNIYQVLSSIQLQILKEKHPYYMEPGLGAWEGENTDVLWERDRTQQPGQWLQILGYEEDVKFHTAKLAILNQLKTPAVGFETVTRRHFLQKRKIVLSMLESWVQKGSSGGILRTGVPAIIKELRDIFNGFLSTEDLRGDVMESLGKVKYIRDKVAQLSLALDAAGPGPHDVRAVALMRSLQSQVRSGKLVLRYEQACLQRAQRAHWSRCAEEVGGGKAVKAPGCI